MTENTSLNSQRPELIFGSTVSFLFNSPLIVGLWFDTGFGQFFSTEQQQQIKKMFHLIFFIKNKTKQYNVFHIKCAVKYKKDKKIIIIIILNPQQVVEMLE